MDARQREFRCRKPWLLALATGGMAAVALASGVWRACWGYPLAPHQAGTSSSLALLGLGLVLAAIAMAALRAALRPAISIVLTDRELVFPRSRFAIRMGRLAWEEITSLRSANLGEEPWLELAWPKGELRITPSLLENPDEFAQLQAALSARLRPWGVPLEERSAVERARRYRPQFTLAYLFLVMTFLATLLGAHRSAYGNYSPDLWAELVVAAVLLLSVPWMTGRLPRWVWTFAVGFVGGFALEGLVAVTWLSLGWLEFSPTAGWFPLTALVWHLASSSPALAGLGEGLRAYLVAATLAGVLGGLLALAGRRCGARLRRHGRQTPLGG